ncbi:MAG: amidase domain-containing protein, partial [Oscillospiraceae bacterium]|nr:amidase domain-containing protein [Oscillospiraceae bacterium]
MLKAVALLLAAALLSGGNHTSTPLIHPAENLIEPAGITVPSAGEGEIAVGLLNAAPQSRGSGALTYNKSVSGRLKKQQEKLLLAYMDLYYESLVGLKLQSPADLFANKARKQARIREGAWKTIIDVRKAQRSNLALSAYTYELTVTGIAENENGSVSIAIRENNMLRFKAFPGTESESYNIFHRFTVTNENGKWLLSSHSQMDSTNMMALGSLMGGRASSSGSTDTATALSEQHDAVLKAHKTNRAQREKQAETYTPEAPADLTWDHDYDRASALQYAMQWVEKRNTDSWPTYDRNGGNCANYTSQCMLAGGIPMDYSGTRQWKWYGGTPNTSQTASGRSASWSAVREFYAYAANNTGSGLVAKVDANYWTGEVGDLIQLGYEKIGRA